MVGGRRGIIFDPTKSSNGAPVDRKLGCFVYVTFLASRLLTDPAIADGTIAAGECTNFIGKKWP